MGTISICFTCLHEVSHLKNFTTKHIANNHYIEISHTSTIIPVHAAQFSVNDLRAFSVHVDTERICEFRQSPAGVESRGMVKTQIFFFYLRNNRHIYNLVLLFIVFSLIPNCYMLNIDFQANESSENKIV